MFVGTLLKFEMRVSVKLESDSIRSSMLFSGGSMSLALLDLSHEVLGGEKSEGDNGEVLASSEESLLPADCGGMGSVCIFTLCLNFKSHALTCLGLSASVSIFAEDLNPIPVVGSDDGLAIAAGFERTE